MAVASGNPPQSAPVDGSCVLLTRHRWAWYFVPGIVVATVLGIVATMATCEAKFLIAPAVMTAMWWYVRRGTPVSGMSDRRLSASPEILLLMTLAAFCVGLILIVDRVDALLTNRPFGTPYQAYHIVVFGPVFAVFFTGVFVFARQADRRLAAERNQKQADPDVAADGGA